MKKIRCFGSQSDEIEAYLRDAGSRPTWDEFKSHKRGESFKKVRDSLIQNQHNLCAYCEIDLIESDRQIEHFIPRSDLIDGQESELEITNLLACCLGGSKRQSSPQIGRSVGRYLEPVAENLSCGQAKSSARLPQDPRNLPSDTSLFTVEFDGTICPDAGSCEEMNIPIEIVSSTIRMLGLNVERLRRARERHWEVLLEKTSDFIHDSEKLQSMASQMLLPKEGGRLLPFFTTTRSFLGPDAESVLDRSQGAWI